MRVLHLAAGNLYGGVERILEEVAVHVPSGSHHEFALSFDGRLSDSLARSGAALHSLGPVRFSRPWSVWRARRRLSRLLSTSSYDALIGHSPWAYALAAPVVRSGRAVLWAHDALRGTHWTERHAARRTPDVVICNSRFTADAVAGWMNAVRREVVYAPVSPAGKDPAARVTVRQELRTPQDAVVILLASRLERWKGHTALLDAARTLRGNWTIWIAGGAQRPHEAEYERELKSRAAELPDPERVMFLGQRSDVARLLQAADVHCQPNTGAEPFGLAFVEALYAGLPVVTSDLGGATEIVTPACGVLVAPGDTAALAAALQALIDDPARRAALGAAGPARAHALCDPDAQMTALERAIA